MTSSTKATLWSALLVNLIELLGMVIMAWIMVIRRGERPERVGESDMMRDDTSSAVQWAMNCRRGKDDPRIGGLVRFLVVLEVEGGWGLQANQVKGRESNLSSQTE